MGKLSLEGSIVKMFDTQVFESGFKKKEFVIETIGDYPQMIKFEVVKDKCDNLEQYNKVGDFVNVSFNIRGNEYKEKYYVSLSAWKIEKIKTDNHLQTEQVEATVGGVLDKVEDDLPF